MPPAARIGDNANGTPHCHSVHPWSPVPHPCIGPIVKGASKTMIGGPPAARLGDSGTHAACCGPNTYNIIKGSGTVLIENMPAARQGDNTLHCGMAPGTIIVGCPTVIIGG